MKIVIFELEDWESEAFRQLSEHYELVLTGDALTDPPDSRYLDADIISASLGSNLSDNTLGRFPNLKLISTRTTGFDHIDLDYCRNHGITVCNVPHYADRTVAEHVFALLLAVSHRVVESVNRTRSGNYSLKDLQGFDLEGKTLGVVGTGSIGIQAIEIASGFRMPVLAYDVHPNNELAEKLGFRYVSLEELLRGSDILTLHVPSNPATRNLISRTQFAQMKKGTVLINTSRGDVVDIEALLEALGNGTIAAAGLDVLPEEPAIHEEAELLRSLFNRHYNLEMLLADHVLARLSNVIITPHSAFNTGEAIRRLLDMTCRNIEAFINGNPQNVVAGPEKKTAAASSAPYQRRQ